MIRAPSILFLLLCLPVCAAQRGQNLLQNSSFEEEGTAWDPYGEGFKISDTEAHSGSRSILCMGESDQSVHGCRQVITLDLPMAHPFRVSGWSKAEGADVTQDYDIYLDLHYEDGTPLWGQIARFSGGTHDWEKASMTFDVAKPVRTIEVHVLFRKAEGKVWFDDIEVCLLPFAFKNVRVLPGLFDGRGLSMAGTTTLPASWSVLLEDPSGVPARTAECTGTLRVDWPDLSPRGSSGKYTLRIHAKDQERGEVIRLTRPVQLKAKRKRDADEVPYALWVESSMKRVLPNELPETVQHDPKAKISVARGEYESFQVVLLPGGGEGLSGVSLDLSDLKCKRRNAKIGREYLTWYQVGFVKIDELKGHPEMPSAVPGWWPDPLLPVVQFDVKGGMSQSVWITVHAPNDCAAGEYEGTLTIQAQGYPSRELPMIVEVYGFEIPVRGHLKTAFALMDGYLERIYGKPLSPELRQRYGEFLLEHRLNPDDISRTSPPEIEDLLPYRDRGLNAFNVLNMVEERGERTWVCWSPLSVYTPEFKQSLIDRLDPYVKQLRTHGLLQDAYIYTFDERGEDFFPVIKEYFGMVKERYPEIKTLTTAHIAQDPKVMADLNVDWNCPLTAVYDFDRAEACRKAGQEVWAYICLGPRYPYANWLADFPLIESRVIWWQAFHQKMDGFLYWGVNIWGREHNDAPLDPSRFPFLDWSITSGGQYSWLHGDGVLLYPGREGPIGSIRLANIRDGLEDVEYLWLLGKCKGDLESAREACRPVTESLTTFTRDPGVLLSQREWVAREMTR